MHEKETNKNERGTEKGGWGKGSEKKNCTSKVKMKNRTVARATSGHVNLLWEKKDVVAFGESRASVG